MGTNRANVAGLLALRLAAGQVNGSKTAFGQPRDDSHGSWAPQEWVVC